MENQVYLTFSVAPPMLLIKSGFVCSTAVSVIQEVAMDVRLYINYMNETVICLPLQIFRYLML